MLLKNKRTSSSQNLHFIDRMRKFLIDSHFFCPFNHLQPLIMNVMEKFTCFLLAAIFMFHLNCTAQKFQHHYLGKCIFLIHHWISLSSNCPHPTIVSLYFNLIFFGLCVSTGFCLAFLYMNPISFSQFLTVVINIYSCFNTFLHLICYTFSIFKAYCFRFSILMLRWLL